MPLFGRKKSEQRKVFEREALPLLKEMFALAYHYTRDADAAQDLVQETYLKAFKEFSRYREGTNIKAWLARILTNIYINSYNRRRLEQANFITVEDYTEAERMAQQAHKEQTYELEFDLFNEFSDEVVAALESLPDEFRITVLLADVFDYKYAEIAEIIGHPIGTVMSRLYRGRQLLRKRLYEFAVREGYIKPDANKESGKVLRLKANDSHSRRGEDHDDL